MAVLVQRLRRAGLAVVLAICLSVVMLPGSAAAQQGPIPTDTPGHFTRQAGTPTPTPLTTNLLPGQMSSGGVRNVFTASTAAVLGGLGLPPTLVSSAIGSASVTANADSSGGVGLSSDGSGLVFESRASNLIRPSPAWRMSPAAI